MIQYFTTSYKHVLPYETKLASKTKTAIAELLQPIPVLTAHPLCSTPQGEAITAAWYRRAPSPRR